MHVCSVRIWCCPTEQAAGLVGFTGWYLSDSSSFHCSWLLLEVVLLDSAHERAPQQAQEVAVPTVGHQQAGRCCVSDQHSGVCTTGCSVAPRLALGGGWFWLACDGPMLRITGMAANPTPRLGAGVQFIGACIWFALVILICTWHHLGMIAVLGCCVCTRMYRLQFVRVHVVLLGCFCVSALSTLST